MKLEPFPLGRSALRWVMISLVLRHGSWLERLFHVPEICLTMNSRILVGPATIRDLWGEMGRFVPARCRTEKFFLMFVQSLLGGRQFSEVVAQSLLDELEYRKSICTYGRNGSHFRLMEVCDVVARKYSGLLRYRIFLE